MSRRIPIVVLLFAACALLVPALRPASAKDAPGPAASAKVRVGTFDPRAVAIAYYRSPLHEQRLDALVAEQKRARAAGDEQRVRQLEKQGKASQDLAHRQAFGNGPYDSLAEQLDSIYPAVAKAHDVKLITAQLAFATPDVDRIDLTDAILQALEADEKTRKVIDDMRRKIASGAYDPATFKGER
jgi:hypothetical protein